MEFIRVNDHMIKCLISEADMDQYDVSIEDFFSRTENAMEFLHEIVKQAEMEVDYRPEGPLTSLQIAPIPDKGIAIFLTEKPQIDLKTILQSLKKGAGIEIPDDIMDSKALRKSRRNSLADLWTTYIKKWKKIWPGVILWSQKRNRQRKSGWETEEKWEKKNPVPFCQIPAILNVRFLLLTMWRMCCDMPRL